MEEWVLIPSGNSDWMTYVIMVNFLLFVFCKWRYQPVFSFLRVIDTPFTLIIMQKDQFTVKGLSFYLYYSL